MVFLIVSGTLFWFVIGIAVFSFFGLNLHLAKKSKIFLLTFIVGGPLFLIAAGIAELYDRIDSSRISNKINDWLEK